MIIDKIQKRYGWTDFEIQKLYYDRFFCILEAIERAEFEELKQDLIHTWQIVSVQSPEPKSFEDYCKELGIVRIKNKKEDHKANKKEADEIIKRIDEDLKKIKSRR